MSALSAARTNISNKGQILYSLGFKTAATQTFYNGALVGVNSAGKLVPAASTASIRIVGVVDLGNLNSFVSALDDEVSVKVGIFPFVNGTSTDACTDADNTHEVYVMDDQTVSRLPGSGRPVAGQLFKIENGMCYVSSVPLFPGRATDAGAGTAYQGDGSTESVVAPGALSPNTHISFVSVDGTDAYTLADGLFKGQQKIVTCIAAANSPVGTVTPATPTGFATVTVIGAVGDSAMFIWTGAAWALGPCFGCTFT